MKTKDEKDKRDKSPLLKSPQSWGARHELNWSEPAIPRVSERFTGGKECVPPSKTKGHLNIASGDSKEFI